MKSFAPETKTTRLDDLGYVSRGRSRHRPRNDASLYGGEYPFFQTGDIKAANFYLTEYSQTYNELGLAQSKMWDKGTLCITIAANIAETAILGIPGCFPDSVVGFVPDPDKADVRFIKYYIDILKLGMQSISRGTTQDNMSVEKLMSFDFNVPDLATQRKIAGILSAYDDLIENNQRRIKILEEMAQSLYREWFVHFRFPGHESARFTASPLGQIPEDWEVKKVGELAGVNAESIRASNAPEEIQYIDIASVSTGSIDNIELMRFDAAPSRARRVVRHGDIIWSTVRPNRRSFSLIIDPEDHLIASTGFAVLTARSVPWSYLYHASTTDDFTSYLVNHASGAAYPAVNSGIFENADVLVPTADLLTRFNAMAEANQLLQHKLQRRNQTLRRTRDLLLPKLLAGDSSVDMATSVC
jgi:type I restriction enzyme S subunit